MKDIQGSKHVLELLSNLITRTAHFVGFNRDSYIEMDGINKF